MYSHPGINLEVSILIIFKINISKQKTLVCWMMVGLIKLFDEVFVCGVVIVLGVGGCGWLLL